MIDAEFWLSLLLIKSTRILVDLIKEILNLNSEFNLNSNKINYDYKVNSNLIFRQLPFCKHLAKFY